jgi:aminopeptidase N
MEHVGAILYNDKRMFISEHPTPDEELNRVELIAHETSHDWFGDMVTMKWFNDVWTKEVFANYMASKISQEQFPKINHDLNFLKSYSIYAMADDRTAGTHPIQQQLDNLQNAGLLYGNIIYEKAPVMMRKMEQQMGSAAFQRGLQKYLKKYAFANADWDNLIDILDKENPKAKLKSFSDVWVKQKGMPDITAKLSNGKLAISQSDPYNRGCLWQQRFKMAVAAGGEVKQIIDVNMQDKSVSIPIHSAAETIIPNYDGMGYGRFIVDENSTRQLLKQWTKGEEINREAMLMNVYENFLMHKLSADECAESLLAGLAIEKNALIASTCCNYLSTIAFFQKGDSRVSTERQMWEMSLGHSIPACRQKLTRTLFSLATDSTVIANLYKLWNEQSNKLLNEDDYMSLSYQLALRRPAEWQSILNKERERISSKDRQREFDFISRGCTPDENEQTKLFESLLQKENRSIEPWAQSLLALLNNPLREPASNRFITPALDELQEIQRTGDIFFPKGWVTALLSGHKSREAKQLVESFISSHPNYPLALKNKLLQAAYYLLNE